MPGFPPGVHQLGGRNAAEGHAQAAREFYAPLLPVVVELRRRGLSLRAIAAELDRRGKDPPGMGSLERDAGAARPGACGRGRAGGTRPAAGQGPRRAAIMGGVR